MVSLFKINEFKCKIKRKEFLSCSKKVGLVKTHKILFVREIERSNRKQKLVVIPY